MATILGNCQIKTNMQIHLTHKYSRVRVPVSLFIGEVVGRDNDDLV